MSEVHSTPYSVKLCECGCGNPAPVIKCSCAKRGYVKGQFHRFISGHEGRNRVQTEAEKAKRRATWLAKTTSPPPDIPKLCDCGCGLPAPLAKRNDKKTGAVKGQPQRFIKNHQPRGEHADVACEHKDRKHYGHGLCRSCWQKKWVKEHPDANTGNEWLRRNPERRRVSFKRFRMKKLYGITFEMFDAMMEKQNGKCANPACNTTFEGKTAESYRRKDGLHVDHDHATGKVRGLLCARCNATLGHAQDKIDRLCGLIAYLEKHQQSQAEALN